METDRGILNAAPAGGEKPEANLAEVIRCRFLPLGGVDHLEPHHPVPIGNPPVLDP